MRALASSYGYAREKEQQRERERERERDREQPSSADLMDCPGDLSPCSKVIAYLAAHLDFDEDRSTAIKAATNLYAPRGVERERDLHGSRAGG